MASERPARLQISRRTIADTSTHTEQTTSSPRPMTQAQYKGHTFKTLSAFIEWAKLNGVRVISERDRQVTIINPTLPKL